MKIIRKELKLWNLLTLPLCHFRRVITEEKFSLKDTRYINCCPTDSQINTVHIKECIVYLLEYNHLFNDKGFQLKFQFAIPAPPEFI